jgi:hypothetical protein
MVTEYRQVRQAAMHPDRHAAVLTSGFSLLALTLLVQFFVPWLAYPLGLCAVYYTARYAKPLTPLALLIFSSGAAIIQASREFFVPSSDFDIYYVVYEGICDSGDLVSGLLYFGPEVGLPVFYYLLSKVNVCGLSISGLAYVQASIFGFLFLLTLGHYVNRYVPPKARSVTLTLLAATLSFYYATQLSRQFISSILLFCALFLASKVMRRVLLLIFSSLCHLTAPAIFFCTQVLRHYSLRKIAMLVVLLSCLTIIVLQSPDFFTGLVGRSPLAYKFAYYENIGDSPEVVLSDYITVLSLLSLGSVMYFFPGRNGLSLRLEYRAIFAMGILGVALLPFPLAATRFLFLYGQILFILYVSVWLYYTNRRWVYYFLLGIVAIKIPTYSDLLDDKGSLWFSYPAASSDPGYVFDAFRQ